jgi:hypothetical protein
VIIVSPLVILSNKLVLKTALGLLGHQLLVFIVRIPTLFILKSFFKFHRNYGYIYTLIKTSLPSSSGRLRQEDGLNLGAPCQLGQHNKTLSQKINPKQNNPLHLPSSLRRLASLM